MGRRLVLLCVVAWLTGPTCAHAAVTFRSASQQISSLSSAAVAEPSGCASGDLLVAKAEVDTTDVTAPSGWTNFSPGLVTQGTTRYLGSYITRGGSAPSLTWSYTGAVFHEIDVLCITTSGGTITLDSQSGAGGKGTDTGVTTQPDPPATVAVASSSLAICMGNNTVGANASAVVAPTGYTLRSLNAVAVDTGMATKALSASGSENPGAFSGWIAGGANDWFHGWTVTFTDVAAGGCTLSPTLTVMGVGNCKGN